MEKLYHIPHSSLYIPENHIHEYSLSKSELDVENEIMTDLYLHEFVKPYKSVVFEYSRLFCDVERYNSEDEVMNDVGMGVLYEKTSDGRNLRKIINKDILEYYNSHHKKLNDRVNELLKTVDKLLFIDLHSYSDKPLEYELYKNLNRPDICIGLNKRYDKKLVEKLIYIIKKFNYSYSINEPFKGCLIPSDFIDDERVEGIMIEINKRCYIGTDFSKIKEFLKWIEEKI
jgi:N-formylglutamate deformylase